MQTPETFPSPPTASTPAASDPSAEPHPRKRLLLVRHGQTTYNVEGRLPGQLPGIALTDEGRRQAHRAAVALSGVPPTAVISSPLERARETAEIIARGWGLPVQVDSRLMDTDIGRWAGQKLDEVAKSDSDWKVFVQHASVASPGGESLQAVMGRAVASVEQLRQDEGIGDNVVLVAHADVIKLIVAHYMGIHVDCARFIHVDTASISALSFEGDLPPTMLALNWTASPGWLTALPWQAPAAAQQPAGGEGPSAPRAPSASGGGAVEGEQHTE